ncbi:response regulator [Neotamlana laminarinivorans]|uniref:Response regulator n=1 Tax=Neotamlana laminarinivorans TaxID=2883124 RepID=A0A9X1HZJ8_9FLAO|nr:response regulator [Tamlana laminarinivorans]MCB4797853.1 response regulator [Tamlana laminarinivorans]
MHKIAIIDDNLLFRKITQRLLFKLNINDSQILLFENGKTAFNYISDNIETPKMLPSVILLDLNMPCINGWEFLELIKKINQDNLYQPIIHIITSSIDDNDKQRAKQTNLVSNYLVKPINLRQLQNVLNFNSNDEKMVS